MPVDWVALACPLTDETRHLLQHVVEGARDFLAPGVRDDAVAAVLGAVLKRAAWWRLAMWAMTCGALASVGGLVMFGRDAKMATYATMVVACALSQWWVGFGPGRR